MKPKINELEKTCDACPSQWNLYSENGKKYYVRYRYGVLRVDEIADYVQTTIYRDERGHSLDGYMSDEEMKEELKDLLDFSLLVSSEVTEEE